MQKIIDFHSHILPKIDDGSRSSEMTKAMIDMMSEQVINTVVATPHFYADSMGIDKFLEQRQNSFDRVKSMFEEKNISVVLGAEVFFFSGISNAEGIERLCFENTKLMMIEMPFRPWTSNDLREIQLLIHKGITPVIAHLERFYQFQKDKSMIPALLDMPVYVQINAESLLHWSTRRQVIKLFRNGDAHLLGSDCHNITSRLENLEAGRQVIEKKLGTEVLECIDGLGEKILGV